MVFSKMYVTTSCNFTGVRSPISRCRRLLAALGCLALLPGADATSLKRGTNIIDQHKGKFLAEGRRQKKLDDEEDLKNVSISMNDLAKKHEFSKLTTQQRINPDLGHILVEKVTKSFVEHAKTDMLGLKDNLKKVENYGNQEYLLEQDKTACREIFETIAHKINDSQAAWKKIFTPKSIEADAKLLENMTKCQEPKKKESYEEQYERAKKKYDAKAGEYEKFVKECLEVHEMLYNIFDALAKKHWAPNWGAIKRMKGAKVTIDEALLKNLTGNTSTALNQMSKVLSDGLVKEATTLETMRYIRDEIEKLITLVQVDAEIIGLSADFEKAAKKAGQNIFGKLWDDVKNKAINKAKKIAEKYLNKEINSRGYSGTDTNSIIKGLKDAYNLASNYEKRLDDLANKPKPISQGIPQLLGELIGIGQKVRLLNQDVIGESIFLKDINTHTEDNRRKKRLLDVGERIKENMKREVEDTVEAVTKDKDTIKTAITSAYKNVSDLSENEEVRKKVIAALSNEKVIAAVSNKVKKTWRDAIVDKLVENFKLGFLSKLLLKKVAKHQTKDLLTQKHSQEELLFSPDDQTLPPMPAKRRRLTQDAGRRLAGKCGQAPQDMERLCSADFALANKRRRLMNRLERAENQFN